MRAFITGVTGQDGSYLAESLAAEGHQVFGLIRGQWNDRQTWVNALVAAATPAGAPGLRLLQGDLLDLGSLIAALEEAQPDVVYNLAAISSPSLAWSQPELAGQVTGLGVLRVLEAVRIVCPGARVVQASSIAIHGPYGAAKGYAGAICQDYADRGMHVSQAVFGGHHSPRRTPDFLSRKVTMAAATQAAAEGSLPPLRLGPLTRCQDWGAAPDFVRALREIGEQRAPGVYRVSTGDPHTSAEFVAAAFATVGLDWREHVVRDDSFAQPTDVPTLTAQPDTRLAWRPAMGFGELVRWLVDEEYDALESAMLEGRVTS